MSLVKLGFWSRGINNIVVVEITPPNATQSQCNPEPMQPSTNAARSHRGRSDLQTPGLYLIGQLEPRLLRTLQALLGSGQFASGLGQLGVVGRLGEHRAQ